MGDVIRQQEMLIREEEQEKIELERQRLEKEMMVTYVCLSVCRSCIFSLLSISLFILGCHHLHMYHYLLSSFQL